MFLFLILKLTGREETMDYKLYLYPIFNKHAHSFHGSKTLGSYKILTGCFKVALYKFFCNLIKSTFVCYQWGWTFIIFIPIVLSFTVHEYSTLKNSRIVILILHLLKFVAKVTNLKKAGNSLQSTLSNQGTPHTFQ